MMYTAGTPGNTPTSFYSPARAAASGNQDESFVHSKPVNSTTSTGQPREPASGIPETDRQAFAEQPSQSRPEMFYAPPRTVSSSSITPLTAALWGIMAAGVWLGCSSGIQVMPSMEQSCLSAALILLFIGWCGFSAAGQRVLPGKIRVSCRRIRPEQPPDTSCRVPSRAPDSFPRSIRSSS